MDRKGKLRMQVQDQQDSMVVETEASSKDGEGTNPGQVQQLTADRGTDPVLPWKAEEVPFPAANRLLAYGAIAATIGIVFGLAVASLSGGANSKSGPSVAGSASLNSTVLAAEVKTQTPVSADVNSLPVDLPAAQAIPARQSSPVHHRKAKKKDLEVPSNFAIEGDDELVGYDQSKGVIQTSARKTFLVAVTGAGSNSSAWQEWPANIHYKCDLNASCALTRKGATVLYAQLKK